MFVINLELLSSKMNIVKALTKSQNGSKIRLLAHFTLVILIEVC